jgi:hypothetical protein
VGGPLHLPADADADADVERPDDQPDHVSGDDAQAARTLNPWVAIEICPLTLVRTTTVLSRWIGRR